MRRESIGNETSHLGRLAADAIEGKKQNKTKLKKTFDLPQLETRNPSFYSSYIHIRAEKVKDDSISTLGHPMHWVARSDKLHLWAHWCEVLSIGSGLTVAAHLTRLG